MSIKYVLLLVMVGTTFGFVCGQRARKPVVAKSEAAMLVNEHATVITPDGTPRISHQLRVAKITGDHGTTDVSPVDSRCWLVLLNGHSYYLMPR